MKVLKTMGSHAIQLWDQTSREVDTPLYRSIEAMFSGLFSMARKSRIIIIPLLLLGFPTFSQVELETRGQTTYAVTDLAHASILAYWGEKGIASVPYIQSLELRLKLLETESKFKDQIMLNHQKAAEEYRLKLEALARERQNFTQDIIDLGHEKDKWKDRAQNRGRTIGILTALIATIAYLNIAK